MILQAVGIVALYMMNPTITDLKGILLTQAASLASIGGVLCIFSGLLFKWLPRGETCYERWVEKWLCQWNIKPARKWGAKRLLSGLGCRDWERLGLINLEIFTPDELTRILIDRLCRERSFVWGRGSDFGYILDKLDQIDADWETNHRETVYVRLFPLCLSKLESAAIDPLDPHSDPVQYDENTHYKLNDSAHTSRLVDLLVRLLNVCEHKLSDSDINRLAQLPDAGVWALHNKSEVFYRPDRPGMPSDFDTEITTWCTLVEIVDCSRIRGLAARCKSQTIS